jgi:hypothetical protein
VKQIAPTCSTNNAKTLLDKKSYHSPVVQVFGKLHLLTQGTGGNGTDADNTMTKMSDRRAKENILRVGTHPLGIGVYLFDYKAEYREACGHGRQLGLMADEVEVVLPEAVSVHPDGYKMVNYGMLGPHHSIQ